MHVPQIHDLPAPPSGRIGWPWTAGSNSVMSAMPNGAPWPRVTIVTPSFNQGRYIEETIRSVLLQGYPNLEYMVLDGGSTDGTPDIIRKYEPWLSYWRSSADGGQAAALREGFARASGDVLGWLNSDDLLLPDALRRVGRYLTLHPGVECCVGATAVVGADGALVRDPLGFPRVVPGTSATHESLATSGAPFLQPAAFWRKTAYGAVGGIDPSFQFAMDLDLFVRLARRRRISWLPELLAAFRVHPESKSSCLVDVRRTECMQIAAREAADGRPTRALPIRRALWRATYLAHAIPFRLALWRQTRRTSTPGSRDLGR
jgi:glycosyltransferase involved in cell wall biosynthesis